MTIEKCLSICRSKKFPYSGLEWSCECHCGHAPEEDFEWAWSDKCDDRCTGDSNQICGGSEAMSVWNTPPETFNGYCVNDYPGNRRVLNDFSITGLEDLTIENCRSICKGKDHLISKIILLIIYYLLYYLLINTSYNLDCQRSLKLKVPSRVFFET